MSNERNGYRTAVVLFAVAVIIAMLMAFGTTLERSTKGWLTARPRPVRRVSLRLARH
jgi:hypothetical protein